MSEPQLEEIGQITLKVMGVTRKIVGGPEDGGTEIDESTPPSCRVVIGLPFVADEDVDSTAKHLLTLLLEQWDTVPVADMNTISGHGE